MAKSDEKPGLTADEKFELLLEALASRPGLGKDDLRDILLETQRTAAEAMKEKLDPEKHTSFPDCSVFNYPEGERARPKPKTAYQFLYNGFPVHKAWETHHWRECELMTLLQPGEYVVIRKDGTRMDVSVKGERDADGKLTKIDVLFPVTRETKGLVPPMSVVLYQMVYAKEKTPKQAFVEAMQEHLNMVLGEVVGA